MPTEIEHRAPSNYSDEWRMSPHPLCLDFVPTAIVDLFPRVSEEAFPELDNYLRNRGISERAYKHFDVRASEWDELVFLFTSILGSVMGIVFRNIEDKRIRTLRLELLEAQGIKLPKKSKRGAWFGLHLVNVAQPLLIVEAELDCAKVWEWDYHNVVSPGGMSATKQQMKVLYNKKIFLGFDSDPAGKEGTRLFLKNVDKSKEVWVVDWSLHEAKDPGDIISSEDFYYCLNTAVRVQ